MRTVTRRTFSLRLSRTASGGADRQASVSIEQALADGVLHQISPIVQVQFLHQVLSVPLHRIGANEQEFANLLGRVPLRYQLQDLLLPVGQPIGGPRSAIAAGLAEMLAGQVLGQSRVEINVSCGDRPHGPQ